MASVVGSEEISRMITHIAHQIIEKRRCDGGEVTLLGIPSGGVPLAQRLGEAIAAETGVSVPLGSLDVTPYRDDLRRRPHRALQETVYPHGGVEDKVVVLVDDVFSTGRTIRAALDALADIGRPRRVELAVLVDREQPEFPIRPDYVGTTVSHLPADTTVVCELQPLDATDRITYSEDHK